MRVAALILGVIGGLFGIGGALFALFAGGVAGAFGAEGAGTVMGLGVAAIPFGVLGVVGGALALAKPKAAGWLMLISAIGGTIAVSAGFIIAGLMLLIGAILSFVEARKPATKATQSVSG